MEERRKYEQWLDELEAKKESTPTKVFDRVRQDYMARLQIVMESLKEHTKTLHDHARELMSKLRELEAQEQAHTEEQAEAELRANVGEITEAEWESSRRKAQRELVKIQEHHEVVADELNQIREVLGGGDEDDDQEESPRRAADFDELEFLKSVVGPAAAAEKPVPEVRKPTPPSTPATPRPVTPASAAAVPARPAQPPPPKASPPPKPVIVTHPNTESALGVRTEDAVEQPKTLKCNECGTMNFASEWYCEQCGGELAAI
jgi:hypothetical protein